MVLTSEGPSEGQTWQELEGNWGADDVVEMKEAQTLASVGRYSKEEMTKTKINRMIKINLHAVIF